jgi:hypothetical protein
MLYILYSIETSCETHLKTYQVGTEGNLSSDVKGPERETVRLPPSIAEDRRGKL